VVQEELRLTCPKTWTRFTASPNLAADLTRSVRWRMLSIRWFPSGIKGNAVRAATPHAAAAPATVSDEPLSWRHWAAWAWEGGSGGDPRARKPAITDVRAESAKRGVLAREPRWSGQVLR